MTAAGAVLSCSSTPCTVSTSSLHAPQDCIQHTCWWRPVREPSHYRLLLQRVESRHEPCAAAPQALTATPLPFPTTRARPLQDICDAVAAALSLAPDQRAALGLAARAAFDAERAAFLDRAAAAELAVEEALMVKARSSQQQQQQQQQTQAR